MLNGEKLIDRPLRWGMVGGGRTGQVGYKHRTGALRDNTAYRMVCGAFDLDAARGKDFGLNLGVAEDRLYPDYQTLIAEEAKRDDGVEVVTIATPNFTHYEITKACLEAGLHVICEKPLFFTVAECERDRGPRRGEGPDRRRHLRLHRPPAGPPDGGDGEEGHARRHPHGRSAVHPRLQRRRRRQGAPDAQKWRTNPKTSGPTFVLGDIGTHIYYLSEIVLPHMRIERLLCDRQSFIKSRAPLEDNAYVLSHYDNGAVGRLWVSSVNAGNMGSQRYRFVGSKASVEWTDSHPDQLIYEIQGEPGRRSCITACPTWRRRASPSTAWARCTPRASATAGPTSTSGSPRRSTRRNAATRRS